jgi:hypothetical protein
LKLAAAKSDKVASTRRRSKRRQPFIHFAQTAGGTKTKTERRR